VAKEKVVYILNPDGLTESIFVAKGEPNEGQYRGKRFTKAGWKAEKKRLKDDMLNQSLEQINASTPPSQDDLKNLEETIKPSHNNVKTWEEYSTFQNTSAIEVIDEEDVHVEIGQSDAPVEVENSTIMVKPNLAELMRELEETDSEPAIVNDNVETNNDSASDSTKKHMVYIVGSIKGSIFVLNQNTLEPISFHENPSGFVSKQEIINYLVLSGIQYPTIKFVESHGESFFTATAEQSHM
jgi:hypothetical protein